MFNVSIPFLTACRIIPVEKGRKGALSVRKISRWTELGRASRKYLLIALPTEETKG
jgi:hypothetical protein